MTEKSTSNTEFDPMNVPTDEAGVAAYAQALAESVVDEVVPTTEPEAGAQADAEAAAKAVVPEAPAPEVKPAEVAPTGDKKVEQVVLTKDGKNTIPYAVLESARKREAEARLQMDQVTQRMQQLEKELADAKAGKPTDGGKATADLLASVEESMSKLESVPEVAEPLKALVETVKSMQAKIDGFGENAKQQEQAAQQREQLSVEEQVNAAIDNNAVLRFWRDKDAAMYNRAADMDAVLRADPANSTLSFDERFEKVVKALEAIHGKAELPAEYQAAATPSETQVRTEVKAPATPAAPAPAAKPMTLSDLPGGAPPISNDQKLDSLSNNQIQAHVGRLIDKGMSPMDIIAALDLPVSV